MTRHTVFGSWRARFTLPSLLLAGLGAGLAAGPLGCARNPVTGKSELSLVSEAQEIQMGQQGAKEVAQSIGFYEDEAVNAYVAEIGKRMAAQSERPNLPWEFHVVNDAAVNAFAIPGGFIYVTRGLMSAINNEAELAGVVLGSGYFCHRRAVRRSDGVEEELHDVTARRVNDQGKRSTAR